MNQDRAPFCCYYYHHSSSSSFSFCLCFLFLLYIYIFYLLLLFIAIIIVVIIIIKLLLIFLGGGFPGQLILGFRLGIPGVWGPWQFEMFGKWCLTCAKHRRAQTDNMLQP